MNAIRKEVTHATYSRWANFSNSRIFFLFYFCLFRFFIFFFSNHSKFQNHSRRIIMHNVIMIIVNEINFSFVSRNNETGLYFKWKTLFSHIFRFVLVQEPHNLLNNIWLLFRGVWRLSFLKWISTIFLLIWISISLKEKITKKIPDKHIKTKRNEKSDEIFTIW